MDGAAERPGLAPIGTALSLLASVLGLVLLGIGAALLARELFNILDQDVRWWPLLQGVAATGTGIAIFVSSSRTWTEGDGPAPTPVARIARTLVAIVAVGVAIVAFATVGVLLAGLLSDLDRFERSCFEMDSITCGFQGAIGGAAVGLAFGIRAAVGAVRGLWIPAIALFLSVGGLVVWLALRQL